MTASEVARIREQIISEYQATQRVFTDFTATTRHDFIQKREENIGRCFEDLKRYLSPDEAILIVVQAEQFVYGEASSSGNTS